MKKKISKSSPAQKLGSVLAHVQDGVDQLVAFGFKKLRQSGTKNLKPSDSPLKKTAVKTAGFIGEAGSSFYQKYEEIKERRRKK